MLIFAGFSKNTIVASILIGQQIEQGNETGAAAISVVLLALALVVLVLITVIQRWGSRHERAQGAGAGGLTLMPLADGGADTLGPGADDLDIGAPGNPPTVDRKDDERE